MKKTLSNIFYSLLPLLFLLPMANSCVDPVGIDDNLIRNPINADTTVVADTIRMLDSIYVIRYDTLIVTKDSVIHRVDTVYMPIYSNRSYIPVKRFSLMCREMYYESKDKSVLIPWLSYIGTIKVEMDTMLTTPSLNIKIDISNPSNSLYMQGFSRQEMATEFRMLLDGFVFLGPPLQLDGVVGQNRSADITLKDSYNKTRLIKSSENAFNITIMDWKLNSNQTKLIGCKLLITAEYYSNSMPSAFEGFLDIDFY